MHRRIRFRLWMLPVLGFGLALAYAILSVAGLFEPWHLAGKPSEDISRIVGLVGGEDIYVETESGDVYSISYSDYLRGNHLEWRKEEKSGVEPDPVHRPLGTWISLPLLFKVKQTYETAFPAWFLLKLALSEDGNLWMWHHVAGDFSGMEYFIYPPIGLVCGSILALVMKAGSFLWGRMRPSR